MQILAPDSLSDLCRPGLVIRRVDAIPVALPLKKPIKMAAETVTHARNILVRIEAAEVHGRSPLVSFDRGFCRLAPPAADIAQAIHPEAASA